MKIERKKGMKPMKIKDEEFIKGLKKIGFKILEINDWYSFDYKTAKVGNAKITKGIYEEGLYLMEGVDGFDLFYVKKPIEVTLLKIKGETEMVDDPLRLIGMKLLAKASEGKVLTAGLGLGLYTIFLQENPHVESVTVVEKNKNVKELIEPMISKYIIKPTKIIIDDIKNWINKASNFDTIMIDLWNKSNQETLFEMLYYHGAFKSANPNAKVFIWGLRDKKINPSVKTVNPSYIKVFVQNLMIL
jgi:hypothetical protein